jgi:hypothetical protein
MTTPNARRLPLTPTADGQPLRVQHAAVYRLEPPLTTHRQDGSIDVVAHVVVSTAETALGVETYAFACDASGVLLSYEEIDGAPGIDNHRRVLLDMGYPYVIVPGQRAIEEGGPGSHSYMSFL